MTQQTPAGKPWFKKKRYIFLMVFLGLAVIGQFTGSDEPAAPQTLATSDIRDASGFDEDNNEYYWGAYFKINELDPMTRVNCTVKALDENGGVLVEESYEGNTLNDKTIIKYGEAGLSTTTKEIVEGISSFDISCTKK
jgi:hypothetical protein